VFGSFPATKRTCFARRSSRARGWGRSFCPPKTRSTRKGTGFTIRSRSKARSSSMRAAKKRSYSRARVFLLKGLSMFEGIFPGRARSGFAMQKASSSAKGSAAPLLKSYGMFLALSPKRIRMLKLKKREGDRGGPQGQPDLDGPRVKLLSRRKVSVWITTPPAWLVYA